MKQTRGVQQELPTLRIPVPFALAATALSITGTAVMAAHALMLRLGRWEYPLWGLVAILAVSNALDLVRAFQGLVSQSRPMTWPRLATSTAMLGLGVYLLRDPTPFLPAFLIVGMLCMMASNLLCGAASRLADKVPGFAFDGRLATKLPMDGSVELMSTFVQGRLIGMEAEHVMVKNGGGRRRLAVDDLMDAALYDAHTRSFLGLGRDLFKAEP